MTAPVLDATAHPHRNLSVVNAVRGGTLTDADFRGCRWIEGDPSPLRGGMFCGLPVAPGESWCAKHRAIVFGDLDNLAGGPALGWQNRKEPP